MLALVALGSVGEFLRILHLIGVAPRILVALQIVLIGKIE